MRKRYTYLTALIVTGIFIITSLYPVQILGSLAEKKTPYMWLLQECNKDVFKKTFEYPFLVILSEKNKKEYMDLDSLKEKKEYIEYYWKKNNPNPLMPDNESLQIFMQRYNYIKKHFSYPKPPYFDDRGKYYLRYGEPSYRFTEPSQIKYAKLFKSDIITSFLGSVYTKSRFRKIYIPVDYSVQGNETWVYHFVGESKQNELVFNFIAEGNFFREVESLDNAIIYPRKSELIYFYWADMIKDRSTATQSLSIFNTLEEILDFEQDVRNAAALGHAHTSFHDINDPHQKLLHIKNKLKVEVKRKNFASPQTLFTPKETIQELLFSDDIVQFKGSQDTTILSINYFVPLSHNFNQDTKKYPFNTLYLQYGCLFENQKLQKVKEKRDEKSYKLKTVSGLNNPYLINTIRLPLLSQPGRITTQVIDELTQKKGFVKRNIVLRDFSTPELCISDIQFCQQVEDSLYKKFYPIIQKSRISVIPYPYERIKRSDQLFCYFEIYNIKTGGIQSQYEVSIELQTTLQEKGMLGKIFGVFNSSPESSIIIHQTRLVEKDDSQELIGIDFSNLHPGYYTLTLRVTDNDNKNISAAVSRKIQITE